LQAEDTRINRISAKNFLLRLYSGSHANCRKNKKGDLKKTNIRLTKP
jgi:hypothetical protein